MKTIISIAALTLTAILFATVSCKKSTSNSSTITPSTNTGWSIVGNAGFSAGEAGFYPVHISIAIDGGGTPYVAYGDSSNGYQATVMKLNGSSWIPVGNPAGFSGVEALGTTSIAIDANGTPYVVYVGNAIGGSGAVLMQYNGSSWVSVGASADIAFFPAIAIYGTTPYIAYIDGGYVNAATVMKYSGGTLIPVGNPGFAGGTVGGGGISLAIDRNGTPYVVYSDVSNNKKATVMKYNSSSGIWVTVGNAGFSAGAATGMTIALDSTGTPYVAYEDLANSDKATVMKFNGSNWVGLGNTDFTAGIAGCLSIAIGKNDTPYVAFGDATNDYKATAMKFNGSSWVNVGGAGFSTGHSSSEQITMSASGVPYVAFQDSAYGHKATVMKYGN